MRKQALQLVALGVIASILGVALALAIDWFPLQASEEARKVDDLYDVLLIASVPIFVLVQAVVLFSVWQWRMRPGQENEDGAPIHGNTRLEVVWTAIPALILLALCTYAYVVLKDIEEKKPNALVVNVQGQQFAWTFSYPGEGGPPVRSEQLYVPENRQVEFKVQSVDVIHDFWVPAFRLKIDAVPGITTGYRVTPSRPGDYPVVCAELCGLGHATMRQTAHVLPEAKFNAWLADMRLKAKQENQGGNEPGDQAGQDPS